MKGKCYEYSKEKIFFVLSIVVLLITNLIFSEEDANVFADEYNITSNAIQISHIDVNFEGRPINSSVVSVFSGQILNLHIIFTYYGDTIKE